MDLGRVRRVDEVDQHPDESKRIVEVQEVPCLGKQLKSAPRQRPMGRKRVLDRDDRVALAPHEQERDRLSEVRRSAASTRWPPRSPIVLRVLRNAARASRLPIWICVEALATSGRTDHDRVRAGSVCVFDM
jgi:hypothetical protein